MRCHFVDEHDLHIYIEFENFPSFHSHMRIYTQIRTQWIHLLYLLHILFICIDCHCWLLLLLISLLFSLHISRIRKTLSFSLSLSHTQTHTCILYLSVSSFSIARDVFVINEYRHCVFRGIIWQYIWKYVIYWVQ